MTGKTYLVDHKTKHKYCVNGLKAGGGMPHKENLREKFSDHKQLNKAQLPPRVDLRAEMTPIEDQSATASCVANSLAGIYEYLLMKTSGRHIDVSRLFIYYNARLKDEKLQKKMADEGCYIYQAIEALEESGTCLESIWPFDESQVNERPNDEAYDAAQDNIITEAMQINVNLDDMKTCLAQGYPFVFGLRLFKSFTSAAKKGVVPAPKASDQSRDTHSNHAMVAVGYSDRSQAFIVRNSWGEEWGFDKGYCFIAYNYMTNPELCSDVWAVRKLDCDDMGHEHWEDDDEQDVPEDAGDEDGDNGDGDEEEDDFIESESDDDNNNNDDGGDHSDQE